MRFIKLLLSTHLIFSNNINISELFQKRIETLQKSHIRDANMKKRGE